MFRMLSMGCACSIGDQLEPDGHVNPTTYKLIGEVYRQFEEREAFALPQPAGGRSGGAYGRKPAG